MEASLAASLDVADAVDPRDSLLVFEESGGSTFNTNLGSGGKNVCQDLCTC